jgi:hypothetical protein
MHRRTFVGTLTGGLLAAPLVVAAQPLGRVARVGVLSVAAVPSDEERATSPFLAAASAPSRRPRD